MPDRIAVIAVGITKQFDKHGVSGAKEKLNICLKGKKTNTRRKKEEESEQR